MAVFLLPHSIMLYLFIFPCSRKFTGLPWLLSTPMTLSIPLSALTAENLQLQLRVLDGERPFRDLPKYIYIH